MATESPLIHDGSQCVAGADLSADQFLAVKLSTAADRTVVLASTGGEGIYGILQNKPTSGQAADVGIAGVSKAVAGNTMTRGDLLMTDTSGKFITATGGNKAVAIALESGVVNQVITVAIIAGSGVGKAL